MFLGKGCCCGCSKCTGLPKSSIITTWSGTILPACVTSGIDGSFTLDFDRELSIANGRCIWQYIDTVTDPCAPGTPTTVDRTIEVSIGTSGSHYHITASQLIGTLSVSYIKAFSGKPACDDIENLVISVLNNDATCCNFPSSGYSVTITFP